jgi:hypothetical protein
MGLVSFRQGFADGFTDRAIQCPSSWASALFLLCQGVVQWAPIWEADFCMQHFFTRFINTVLAAETLT